MSDEHATIDDILPHVEQLAGDDRVVWELPGGLTNTNYKIVVGGHSYVVRVSSKDAGLLAIDRDNEYRNSLAAAEAGVGAGVVAYLPEMGALVLDFIEGSTMSAEELRAGDRLRRGRRGLPRAARLPALPRRLQHVPLQERYVRIVRGRGLRLPERYLEFASKVP